MIASFCGKIIRQTTYKLLLQLAYFYRRCLKSFLVCFLMGHSVYSDRRWNGQKPPRTKPSRQKTPDKTPRTKTPRTKTYPLCLGAPNFWGAPRSVTYFSGVPRCVTKCDREDRGVNMILVQNSVTNFIDGPSQPSVIEFHKDKIN